MNGGNRRETDKDPSLWVDVDSKHIYMYIKQVPVSCGLEWWRVPVPHVYQSPCPTCVPVSLKYMMFSWNVHIRGILYLVVIAVNVNYVHFRYILNETRKSWQIINITFKDESGLSLCRMFRLSCQTKDYKIMCIYCLSVKHALF